MLVDQETECVGQLAEDAFGAGFAGDATGLPLAREWSCGAEGAAAQSGRWNGAPPASVSSTRWTRRFAGSRWRVISPCVSIALR